MDSGEHPWRQVHTVESHKGVHEAARIMAREAVGCLVVVDEAGKAVGMLTDRDLALRVLARPPSEDRICVANVMSHPLVWIGADAPTRVAIQHMKKRGIRRVPVLDGGGRPLGIVVFDDLLHDLSRELSDLSEEARAAARSGRRHATVEGLRHDVEEKLVEMREQLERTGWFAREAFLHELDEIRDRLRGVLDTGARDSAGARDSEEKGS